MRIFSQRKMHIVYRNYRECSTGDSVTILFENESAIYVSRVFQLSSSTKQIVWTWTSRCMPLFT